MRDRRTWCAPLGRVNEFRWDREGLARWARSAEFMQTPVMNTLRWLRGPGDMVFAIGVLAMAYFAIGLAAGWSTEGKKPRGKTTLDSTTPASTTSPGEAPAMARSAS